MKKDVWLHTVLVMFVMTLFIACSNENASSNDDSVSNNSNSAEVNTNGNNGNESNEVSEGNEPEPLDIPDDPVELIVSFVIDEQIFNDQFKDPIEDAFPHITLTQMNIGYWELEEAIAAQQFPDIIVYDNAHSIPVAEDIDMAMPLDELVNRHNTDLSLYNPSAIERTRSFGSDDQLMALPLGNAYGLLYNRDIFDMFGEPYPEDFMTWDEIIDLGTRISGDVDGTTYRGFHFDALVYAHKQLSLNVTDPETGEIQFMEDDGWYDYFDLVDRIVSDPTLFPDGAEHFGWAEGFLEDRNIGMFPWWETITALEAFPDLNFDVVTMPTWPDQPNIGPYMTGWVMGLSATTEHEDVAYQVIEYLSYDVEHNKYMARRGHPTPLENPEVIAEFGADLPGIEDVNAEAYFKLDPAEAPTASRWDSAVNMIEVTQGLADAEMDVVSYMREMTEQWQVEVDETIEIWQGNQD